MIWADSSADVNQDVGNVTRAGRPIESVEFDGLTRIRSPRMLRSAVLSAARRGVDALMSSDFAGLSFYRHG